MVTKYSKRFAELIGEYLDGRTQLWLAKATEMSQSRISRYMDGAYEPSISEIGTFAEVFGISPRDFFDQIYAGKPRSRLMKDEVSAALDEGRDDGRPILRERDIKRPPIFGGAGEFLSLFESLPPERKALVSMLVFDDELYLADNPALARAVANLLKD